MLIHSGKCDCEFCRLSRKIHGLMRRQTSARDEQMILYLTNRLTHAEDDADYWRLRCFKAWPSAQIPKPAKAPKGFKVFAPTNKELYQMAKRSMDGRAHLRRRIGVKAK